MGKSNVEKKAAQRAKKQAAKAEANALNQAQTTDTVEVGEQTQTLEVKLSVRQAAEEKLRLRVRELGTLVSNDMVNRPSRATGTGSVNLETNHFVIKLGKLDMLQTYSISINPAPTSQRMRRRILYLLLNQYAQDFARAATDYSATLVSIGPVSNSGTTSPPTSQTLPSMADLSLTTQSSPSNQISLQPQGVSVQFEVNYYGECEERPRDPPTLYTVTLDSGKDISIKSLIDFVSQLLQDPGNGKPKEDVFAPETVVTALNILLAHKPNQAEDVVNISRNSFFNTTAEEREALTGGLEAYIGFTRSVKLATDRLLLNVNATASAFYVPGTLEGLMIQAFRPHNQIRFEDRVLVTKFIKGLRVVALYGKKRVYTVFGLPKWDHFNQRPTANNLTFTRDAVDAAGQPKIDAPTGELEQESLTVRQYLENSMLRPTCDGTTC